MAKKKNFYAVKVGKAPGIYKTWNDCKAQTDGVSGALYQGFVTLEEAERYMAENSAEDAGISASDDVPNISELNAEIEDRISSIQEDEVIAFVDGSYDPSKEAVSFGTILFSYGGGRDTLYKAFTQKTKPEYVKHNNVSGELEGVIEAVNWAIQYSKSKITIYYDYSGIGEWSNGTWKANNPVTTDYVRFIAEKRDVIEMEFIKVPAHAGVTHNDEADELAKSALLANGYKTYNDGSVYFVGYSVDDWKAIIDCINDENSSMSDMEQISPLEMEVEEIDAKKKIKISQARNKVSVNCYRNSKSYVQGKQTVLFQKIISTAIELLNDGQRVVETLNHYHALNLPPADVENEFSHRLPHYRHDSDKHYANLLSAVYNTMLTGYMPDYTCLVTPIFRAYEYYLHRILGDLMGLPTETEKGANQFSYFTQNTVGKYECSSQKKQKLSEDRLGYLNTLYTTYNSVRHPYSHWSASDIDTAVITNMSTARQILSDGLDLVDQYYTLF